MNNLLSNILRRLPEPIVSEYGLVSPMGVFGRMHGITLRVFTFVVMEIGERIAAIIKVNQHTAASFADAVGVQRSAVSHILNGRNKPSLDFLQKVLMHFPRVDAGWLITGKSPPNAAAVRPPITAPQDESDSAAAAPDPESVEQADREPSKPPLSGKSVERIVVFYTDRTFDTYEPN